MRYMPVLVLEAASSTGMYTFVLGRPARCPVAPRVQKHGYVVATLPQCSLEGLAVTHAAGSKETNESRLSDLWHGLSLNFPSTNLD